MADLDAEFEATFGLGQQGAEPGASPDEFDTVFGAPSPEPELDISDTLERGFRTLGSNTADFFGQHELSEEISAGSPSPSFPNFRDIEGLGDAGSFIGERTLESLPQTGLAVLGGIGGFAVGGPIGAFLGAATASGIPLTGESRRAVIEGGGEGTLAQGAPAGVANTALELFPVAKVAKAMGLNKVFKDVGAEVMEENSSLVGEVLSRTKDVADIAATEGVVEAMQELNNKFNERFFNDKEVLALNAEDREELLQAFVGGAAGGTGIGATATTIGAVRDALPSKPSQPTVSPEAKQIQEDIQRTLKALDESENVIEVASKRFQENEEDGGLAFVAKERREGPGASIFGHHVREETDVGQDIRLRKLPVRVGVAEDGKPVYRARGELNVAADSPSRVVVAKLQDVQFGEQVVEARELEESLVSYTQGLLDKLGIQGMKVSLMDEHGFDNFTVFDELGSGTLGGFARGKESGAMVVANMAAIKERSENAEEFKAKLFETVSHEMGHAIINHQWEEIGGGIGNPKKGRVYKALVGEYREWLRDVSGLSVEDFFGKYDPPQSNKLRLEGLGKEDLQRPMVEWMQERTAAGFVGQNYFLSFDEYAAQQMARVATKQGRKLMSPEAQGFWQKMLQSLKALFEDGKDNFAPNTTFEAWVDGMFLRRELEELVERQLALGTPNEGTKQSASEIETQVDEQVDPDPQPIDGMEMGAIKLATLRLRMKVEEKAGLSDTDQTNGLTVSFLDRDGEEVGAVRARRLENGDYRVFDSFLFGPLRGDGLGAFLYNSLIAEARARGAKRVLSDGAVSASAQRVWESLGKQGYLIERSPAPLESTEEGLRTGDLSPMFVLDVQSPLQFTPPDESFIGEVIGKMGLGEASKQADEHGGVVLRFLKVAKLLTPLQLGELAATKGVLSPQKYMELVREFANTKMKQIEIADTIAQDWRKLGKTKSTQLGNFLFAVSDLSDSEGRRLTTDELEALRQTHKVDDETFAMWRRIDESFQNVLGNVERGLILDAATSYIADPARARAFRDAYMALSDEGSRLDLIEDFTGIPAIPDLGAPGDIVTNPLKVELDKIQSSIKGLQDKNYFPRSRLGQYTVTIKAGKAGQEWEGHVAEQAGETLGFYSYESKRERDAQLKAMRGEALAAGLSIVGSKMDTKVFAMMGMPDVLIQRIIADESMDLTQDQIRQLKDISLNLSPGKKFLRNLKKRRGIAGFSEDGLRVYANYMMSAANHLARVEHSKSMLQVLQEMDSAIQKATREGVGEIIDDLVQLKDYFREHFDYLMKPDNDWAQLRAVGFLWYLGFNVKSALVNLTQIPLVTYPVMSGRFGDENSLRAISKSYKSVTDWLRGKEGALTAEEEALIQQFREAGIIDESMVMELAGLGEEDVLKRAIPGFGLDNMISKVSYYGGMMFRLGEKYNRLVTAVAAFRAAREAGQGVEEATKTAREMIEKSQFEYAKWNRPEFMRGKKSVIFLFWQYMQHATFLFAGGAGKKTAARMWIMALLVAGIEGLPFWNTLVAMLDFGGTQAKKALGVANPRVALEEDIRELLLEITDKPDLVLRGASSYWGLGPAHLATLLGAPIPNVDIQGSLGFGSPVPFLDELFVGQGDPDEELGRFTAALLGPVGGMGLQAYRQISSTDPNVWKRVEKSMPVFAKNAMQGSRWLTEGRETFRGEGTFLNMDRPEDRVGAVMKALGFTPTRLSQKYFQVRAQQESTMFWTLRRQLLLEDFAYARAIQDREAQADVTKAIKKHNGEIRKNRALRGMGITGKDLSKSLKARQRSVQLRERGIPQSKRARPLAQEIGRLFPVEGEER